MIASARMMPGNAGVVQPLELFDQLQRFLLVGLGHDLGGDLVFLR
jgi:hypothetical protein